MQKMGKWELMCKSNMALRRFRVLRPNWSLEGESLSFRHLRFGKGDEWVILLHEIRSLSDQEEKGRRKKRK